MGSILDHHWPEDPRSTAELFTLAKSEYLSDEEPNETPSAACLLRRRATPEVLESAERFCRSEDALERQVGASILGQIGWNIHAFQSESVALLIPLLADPDTAVVAAAASALGHRRDPLAIPHVLPLIRHPDCDVRFGVMAALSCLDDPRAIAGLIELSRDVDVSVRDWATFGLGSQTEVDTPALCEALVARTLDEDSATRGEALVGLANRHDERVIEPLIQELQGEYHGTYAVEAAAALGLPIFYKLLLPLRAMIQEHHPWCLSTYEEALVACRPPG